MTRKHYRCPDCQGTFAYDHHPSIEADPLPADGACPHCGFTTASPEPAVVAPHIGQRIKATVDTMYRDMEDGSRFRADVMREKFGLDADEARVLIETNMKDNLRPGDTTAIPVTNDVSRAIDAAPQAFGFTAGAASGVGYSPHVQSGPFPNAGLRAMQSLRSVHPQIVASTGHKTQATSSLPGLETTAPGYRPRI